MSANIRFEYKQYKQIGFTLIELMVVVVILAILATFIAPNIISRPDDAKIVKAKQDILTLENSLEMYRLDNGFYPSTDQGLQALIERPAGEPSPSNWRDGGYIKKLSKDPWGQPYQYLNPGLKREIDIFSLGKDAKPGGDGIDRDIGNWNDEAQS